MIEAAGGVPYRYDGNDGLVIAVVHRPRYDDWSLPKGKLRRGESAVAAAVRETAEETGQVTHARRPLGERWYDTPDGYKRVRYWALHARGGSFSGSAEVDRMSWLPPDGALARLHPERDRAILQAFLDDPVNTCPLVVLRHASAGSREKWAGSDSERPLDERGRRQADGLRPILAAYGVQWVTSSPVARCLQTLSPFAERHGLSMATDCAYSEEGFARNPSTAPDRLLEAARRRMPGAVCSQGKAIPGMLRSACRLLGATPVTVTLAKGGYCVLHLTGDADLRLAELEQHQPAP